jgi:hypothetical protein
VEPIETAVEAVARHQRQVAIVGTVERTGALKLVVLANAGRRRRAAEVLGGAQRRATLQVKSRTRFTLIPPGTLRERRIKSAVSSPAVGRARRDRRDARGPAFQMAGLWIANTANLVRRGTWISARGERVGPQLAARFVGGLMTLAGASGRAARCAPRSRSGQMAPPEGTQMRGPVVIISQRSIRWMRCRCRSSKIG